MEFENLFGTDSFMADTEKLDNLTKALSAGYGYAGAPGSLTGGGALQMESLDATLKAVTWDYRHLRLWPIIPKDKAFNTVEEYNRQLSYGEQQNGGFFDAEAGAAPAAQDANFNRELQKVRYMGTTRSVSHPLTLARTIHAPAMALQIKAGTMWILEQMERQLWEANGYFQATGSSAFTGSPANLPLPSLKYNGIDQQVRFGDSDATAKYTGFDGYNPVVTVVKDMAGLVPDEDDVTDWAYMQSVNFGIPTHAFWSLKSLADVSRTMLPKERVVPPGQEGRGGFLMTEFLAGTGVFKMVGSRFLEPKRGIRTAVSAAAPAAPVFAVAIVAAVAGEASIPAAAGYFYRVSAFNQFDESLAAAQQATGAVGGGNVIQVTINAGTATAQYYAIYRSLTTGTGWEFVGFIADGNVALGAVFRDGNVFRPGLGHAYLMQLDADNVVWRQLAPLLKMDLAILSPAYRWMQLLYGTPIIFKPLHNAIMDNIGRA